MPEKTVSHYDILEKLGEGPTGSVYKARDTKRDRDVALKFLPTRQQLSELDKSRLRQDATRATLLVHPNIRAFYSLKIEKNECFAVLEYVDGKTLKELLPIESQQVAINYAIYICSAFQEAHSKGIIHGNLRPEGVMVIQKKRVKVLGFGEAPLKEVLKLTRTTGTPEDAAYISPEQIEGVALDARSDVFSLGVLLYHMVSGQLPFKGDHEAGTFYAVQNEKPVSIRQYRPDLSPGFVTIIDKALEKKPADRYRTVDEMLAEFRHLKRASFSISKVFTRPVGNTGKLATQPFRKYQGKKEGMAIGKMLPLLLGILLLILLAIIAIRMFINP
ncbi:MAG TPA: serine/threonine-protein kinase [Bacteroidota bacterium]|nr:serine/threonine-protein kinase [Bacteroidota bacterium]